ncbi:MAG TPA: alpha/beta hydrolase [Streptosporangiaceae bacterium]
MPPGLAYDIEGSGTPVVFLHGLTFDRRMWRPVIDRLDGSVMTMAIDLPGHGESGGEPAPLEKIADMLHELLTSLAVQQPVMVGHSMSAGLVGIYASAHPVSGLVMVDQGTEVRPFAELLHRLAPVLRGPGFADAWQTFESTLGLDLLPEPVRSLALATHRVKQDVVLGYWDQVMTTDPAALQEWIDERCEALTDVPALAVFGRPLTDGERQRFERLKDVQIEVWAGDGHCVHLVDPGRFAATLSGFITHCTQGDSRRA